MTVQPLERTTADLGNDRYLAAYAAVHSLLDEPGASVEEELDDIIAAQRPAPAPAIPAARLARSTGGRHKVKRRLFRPAPATTSKVALATG